MHDWTITEEILGELLNEFDSYDAAEENMPHAAAEEAETDHKQLFNSECSAIG